MGDAGVGRKERPSFPPAPNYKRTRGCKRESINPPIKNSSKKIVAFLGGFLVSRLHPPACYDFGAGGNDGFRRGCLPPANLKIYEESRRSMATAR